LPTEGSRQPEGRNREDGKRTGHRMDVPDHATQIPDTATFNDLHNAGLVALEPNLHHRRAQLVVLTDKGRRTLDAAMRLSSQGGFQSSTSSCPRKRMQPTAIEIVAKRYSAIRSDDLCGKLRPSFGNQDVADRPPSAFNFSSRLEQFCPARLDP
jgi:hypothetical protein